MGLTFDEEWIILLEGKRQKMRRVNQQSWDQAWQFVHYRESLKVQPEPEGVSISATDHPSIEIADHPPVSSSSEASRGVIRNHRLVRPFKPILALLLIQPLWTQPEVPALLLDVVVAFGDK